MPDPYQDYLDDLRIRKDDASVNAQDNSAYGDYLKRATATKKASLSFSLDHGSQQNADEKARNLTLAKHLQLPVEAIEADPANAHRLYKLGMVDMDALKAESPNVASWLENPNNASIAHDDIDGLRAVEGAARSLTWGNPEPDTPELRKSIEMHADAVWKQITEQRAKPPELAAVTEEGQESGGPTSAPKLTLDDEYGQPESRDQVIDLVRRSMRLPSLLPQEGVVKSAGRGFVAGVGKLAAALIQDEDMAEKSDAIVAAEGRKYAPGSFAENLAVSMGASVPVLGALAVSRGRVAGGLSRQVAPTLRPDQIASLSKYLVPAEISALSLAQNVNDKNQTPEEAILNAALEGAFTRVGGAWEPFIGSGPIKGKLLLEVGKEAAEEGATAGSQDIVSQTLGKNTKPYDFYRTLEQSGMGAVAGSIFAGAYGIPKAAAEYYTQQASDAANALDYFDGLNGINDALKASKTNQRSPEEVADLTQTMLGQANRHVYVDAEQFRSVFSDPLEAATKLGIAQEYSASLVTRAQVQVPTKKLLEIAAANPEYEALFQSVRSSPTAPNKMEADEFQVKSPDAIKQLQAEARAQVGQGKSQHEKDVEQVASEAFQRLDAVAPDNIDRAVLRKSAQTVANAYGNLAKATGKSVKEIYNVKIKGDSARLLRGEKYDLLDSALERLRSGDVPSDEEVSGPSLSDFLRDKGLTDKALSGELKSLTESDKASKPRQKSIVQPNGRNLDEALLAAKDAGYLPEGATINDLLKALDNDLRGGDRTYSASRGNPQMASIRGSLSQLEAALREAGIDINSTNKEIRKALADYEARQYSGDSQEYNQSEPTTAPMPDTIEIDGVQRSTLNSNGKRIAQTEEQVRNFWKWFGDSKVVDEQGRPLVVYHGTESNISEYNDGAFFAPDPDIAKLYGDNVTGVYIKADRLLQSNSANDVLASVADSHWIDGKAKESAEYYKGKNTQDLLWGASRDNASQGSKNILNAVSENFDAVFFTDDAYGRSAGTIEHETYFVTDGRSVKSATGNKGTFNPADASILNQPTILQAPKSGRLDLDALVRQLRKATGDRTPLTSAEDWQNLVEVSDAVDAANGVELNQTVFHGTPHKFDKFTTDHMGSGEGVQAYGWGLYFAESKDVAQYYRDMLSPGLVAFKGKSIATEAKMGGVHWLIDPKKDLTHPERVVIQQMILQRRSYNDIISEWKERGSRHAQVADIIPSGEEPRIVKGHLYEVAIPDDGEYLLWDKTIDEQPEAIKKSLERLRELPEIYQNVIDLMDQSTVFDGLHLYRALSHALKGDEMASKELQNIGIKGIKYLDGNSRSDGKGSFNYVIFDGADVAITQYNQLNKSTSRATISFPRTGGFSRQFVIRLTKASDASSYLHESFHGLFELMGDLAAESGASDQLKADWAGVKKHLKDNAKDIRSDAMKLARDAGASAEEIAALSELTDKQIGESVDIFETLPNGFLREAMHEYLARTGEAYMLEGKAPSKSLQGAFSTIRVWMLAIYRALKNLRVNLSPEIVSVMDRLMVADAATEAAEVESGSEFDLPAETFQSKEDHEKYLKSFADSREKIRSTVAAQLLRAEKQQADKAYKAKRDEVRASVYEEISSRPVYAAIDALREGETKLDREDLVQNWGDGVLKKLPGTKSTSINKANRGRPLYANEGGQPVGLLAKAMGFTSGDAMVEQLIAADDRNSLVEIETDKRMKELFPDPIDDGSLLKRATAAMSSEQRDKMHREELDALGKRSGQTPSPVEVIRQIAIEQIANTPVYNLAPHKFKVAEAKANREAFNAALDRRWPDAYRAKTQAIINHEMFKASTDAVEASEQGRKYLKSFESLDKRARIGKAGGWEYTVFAADSSLVASFDNASDAKAEWAKQPAGAVWRQTNGYLEQILAVMDGYKLRYQSNLQLQRRQMFVAWLEKQAADDQPVDVPEQVLRDVGMDGSKDWKQLTVQEQAAVVDAVRNIETMALHKNRLLKNKSQRDAKAAEEEIVAGLKKNQPKPRPDGDFKTPLSEAAKFGWRFFEWHRKDSFLARFMDGDVDLGPAFRFFVQPRNEAATDQETRSAIESRKLSIAFKEWGKTSGYGAQVIEGTKLRLTTEQRLSLALNWGHKEGRQRVMNYLERGGWGLPDAQAVLDSLDKSDWKLVNAVLRQIDSYWSEALDLEMRTKGLPLEKVAALPFNTKEGVQSGGYYPIKYDAERSLKGSDLKSTEDAKAAVRAANVNAQTRRGHTKTRADQVKNLAIRFDFDVIGEHMSEVIHDVTHREMIMDQNKLLKNENIEQTIILHYGKAALQQLNDSINAIAIGDEAAKSKVSSFFRFLRVNSSAATFGFNMTSALMNVTGFLQSMTRVGPHHMAQAVAQLFQARDGVSNAFEFAESKSQMMKNRPAILNREIADATKGVQPGSNLAKMRALGWYPMRQVQRVVDTATWTAAYNQSMAKLTKQGMDLKAADEDAVKIADQTVIDTQGSGRIGDLSQIERGGELAKIVTAFYSYFNVAANIQGSAIARVRKNVGSPEAWLRLVSDTALVWTLPALFASLIKSALQGDDRDEDEWLKSLALEQVSYGMGMLVGVREASGLVDGHFGYSGPAGTRSLASLAKALSAPFDGDLDKVDAKAFVSLTGSLTGMPSVQINRLIDAITEDLAAGNEEKAMRRLLFGAERK